MSFWESVVKVVKDAAEKEQKKQGKMRSDVERLGGRMQSKSTQELREIASSESGARAVAAKLELKNR